MDFKSLVGTYLRLRDELGRTREVPHSRRLIEEMERLERRLAQECIPFAETLPLELPVERGS
jgi:hypothetical protein